MGLQFVIGQSGAGKSHYLYERIIEEARKNEDISWIKAYGYNPIHLNDLNNELGKFDIIINTIPFQILDEERLNLVNKDAVLIDLASNPGGIDRKVAKENNIKTQ